MRDFRMIRDFEVRWKNAQEESQHALSEAGDASVPGGQQGGLEDMLNEMLEERGMTDDQYF